MSSILQGQTFILFKFPTIKTKFKIGAKEWNDDIWFRNYLLWTGLGGNYFLCAKTFWGNK